MKKLSPLQEDTLKQFTIDRIKEIDLGDLQQEYISPAKFKEKDDSKDSKQIDKPDTSVSNRR